MMTSRELKLASGAGFLSRSDRGFVFSVEPDTELHNLVGSGSGDMFKALAARVVASDFELVSFVAVDTERNSVFLFGDLSITVDGAVVSGADSATWIERPVEATSQVSHIPAGMSLESGTNLVHGSVRAAGFSFESLDASGEVHAQPAAPVVHDYIPASTPPIFDGDDTEPPMADADEPIPAEPASPESASPESALPESASPESALPESASPESALPEPALSKPAPFRPPPTQPSLRGERDLFADPQVESHAGPPSALHASESRRARVSCSNGRALTIDTGLLVGRFPTKHGVPDGYDALKVTGSEISRVHLDLAVIDGKLLVRDCDTSNGSTLISGQGPPRAVPRGEHQLVLSPGDVVEFGDQAVTFVGWDTAPSGDVVA